MSKHKHMYKMGCCDPDAFQFGANFKFKKMFGEHQKTTNGDLVITVPLPGIIKDSIKIRAKNDKMTLTAERKTELTEALGGKEIHMVLELDESVVPNSAKAKYVDGVLTITFPLETPGYEVEDINYE